MVIAIRHGDFNERDRKMRPHLQIPINNLARFSKYGVWLG